MTNVIDAGQRCADAVNLALHLGGMGKFVAARLSDGGTDGSIYDTKADAIRHQFHETQCAYIKIPPGGMTPADAARFLEVNRILYQNGMRISDPNQTPVLPGTVEEYNIFRKVKK